MFVGPLHNYLLNRILEDSPGIFSSIITLSNLSTKITITIIKYLAQFNFVS